MTGVRLVCGYFVCFCVCVCLCVHIYVCRVYLTVLLKSRSSPQVHEKSLLLTLVPTLCLLPLDPSYFAWYQLLGVFTLFPLLVRDGLRGVYFVVIGGSIICGMLVFITSSSSSSSSSGNSQNNTSPEKGVWKVYGLPLRVNIAFWKRVGIVLSTLGKLQSIQARLSMFIDCVHRCVTSVTTESRSASHSSSYIHEYYI